MCQDKVWSVNEYQKQFDLFLKVFVRMCVAWYVVGFLRFLPDDLSDRIVNKFLAMIGLG
jgi:hypothetical protein